VENCILETNEIKLLLILGVKGRGWKFLFEKRRPDGRSKVWGKKSRTTYMRICRDNDVMQFSILTYFVGHISSTITTKDVSNKRVIPQFP
jgi:hypothetical protein